MTVDTNANLPAPSSPVVLQDGRISPEWWRFFLALLNRTGGPGSPIDINTLQKQDEISQDVPPQNAATMTALQGVQDLWGEQRAPENLTDIRNRLADLESALQATPDLRPIMQKLNDLEAWLADIKAPQSVIVEQWTAPTLTNSWVEFASGYNPSGYYKDPFGIVHLRGVIKSGTIGAGAFTLPAGYRPANTELISAISADAAARLEISNAGVATPKTGTNTWFSLDSVTFRAA